MLFVITTSKMFGKITQEWHVGEPIPSGANERVVTFQADGDELDLFCDAMLASHLGANGIRWDKGKSFQVLPDRKKIYRIWYRLGPKFGSAVQLVPTGQTFEVEARAKLWIELNPAHVKETRMYWPEDLSSPLALCLRRDHMHTREQGCWIPVAKELRLKEAYPVVVMKDPTFESPEENT